MKSGLKTLIKRTLQLYLGFLTILPKKLASVPQLHGTGGGDRAVQLEKCE
jgi:hypothetical protein